MGALHRLEGERRGHTATHYSLLEFTAAPGAAWSTYHTYATTEAWYVVEGELTFRLDGQRLAAPAGSFLLAPGGVPHTAANLGPAPARYVVIFSPAGLERWFVDVARLTEAAKPGKPDPGELSALAALRHRDSGITAPSRSWQPR